MTGKIEGENIYLSVGKEDKPSPREYNIVYSKVLLLVYWHLGGLYGLYLSYTTAKQATILLNCVIYGLGGYGVTAGAHRLWSHRSYKANLPLQVLLMLFQTLSYQGPVVDWARDHRLHHKYCDTDADPHNSKRGFFYSHIGCLIVTRHPDVIRKGKTIPMEDLEHNAVLKFQERYYLMLTSLLVFLLPALIPVCFWQETLNNAHHISILRLIVGSHIFYCINSVAHIFGHKTYNKNISSTQNVSLSLVAFGEGFHNYHHVFPFDYRVSELGNNCLNFSTIFIDFFAWIGWAYDLKHVPNDMIMKTAERTGDGTDLWGKRKDLDRKPTSNIIWGWGDRDMSENDKKMLLNL